ncbi:hypothetical protein HYH03_016612 [Edaphochlamys debaryana]|uniref:Uncharacterized protein n=1 Tax=Edaphochlamys debaryana TaxID=47281 RepID=A0A835XLR8_9CHLO|nr:hypothetical protein HYH03_016612 [Edaphochlamys debaryana]|eukprot:KAG2484566.1 hypothetical protein HYH03_016612 [Edaphochlamys debaryana]
MAPNNTKISAETPWRMLLDFHCMVDYTEALERQLAAKAASAAGGAEGEGKEGREEGKGISGSRRGVVWAGGGRYLLANILVGVTYLREALGSKLPVEVIYQGEAEMEPTLARMLTAEKLQPVKLVDASRIPYPSHHRPVEIYGFTSKVWALYAGTSFDEVLLMDADNYPLVPPEEIFEMEEYKQYGNAFWPDFWHSLWTKDDIWHMFGSKAPWEGNPHHRTTESGQVLVNRKRMAVVLEWIWYVNSHRDFTYRMMHGDKDTYKLAFYLAGKLDQFNQVPVYNSMALKDVRDTEHHWKMQSVYQYSFKGLPLFYHQSKFFPHIAGDSRHNLSLTEWLSVPASDRRAMFIHKEGMALWDNETDFEAHRKCGFVPGPDKGISDIMTQCGWKQEETSMPIPVVPRSWLPRASASVDALTATFWAVRDRIEALRYKECKDLRGFKVYPGMDRIGDDMSWHTSLKTAYRACVGDAECKAFNLDGWIKRSSTPMVKERNCIWVKLEEGEGEGEEGGEEGGEGKGSRRQAQQRRSLLLRGVEDINQA